MHIFSFTLTIHIFFNILTKIQAYFLISQSREIDTHTHTHTHIYIYIYIYIEREREREILSYNCDSYITYVLQKNIHAFAHKHTHIHTHTHTHIYIYIYIGSKLLSRQVLLNATNCLFLGSSSKDVYVSRYSSYSRVERKKKLY